MGIGQKIKARREALGIDQVEFAKALKISQAAVSQWESGETEPYNKRLKLIAKLLDCSVSYLTDDQTSDTAAPESPLGRPNAAMAPTPERPDYVNKIRELGLAQAGREGQFYLNGETVDYHNRPPGLAHRMRVYCIRVQGDSMSPAHEDGDLIFVDAAMKPFPGRDALIEMKATEEGGSKAAFIKRVVTINSEFVELMEFKPKQRTFRVERRKIENLHLVLKNNDMY